MTQQTIIVGGGLAGLSAAVCLAGRGVPVTVLESRPRLGGRAGSFLDKPTGEWIDTCQHVAMGCCTNLQHFCRTLGIEDLFRTEEEVVFIDRVGRRSVLRSRARPAPFHLQKVLPGGGIGDWLEQVRLGRDLLRLGHPRWAEDRGLSFLEWLERHGRTLDLREQFWDPVLVSALSETLEHIAVPYARKVFVDGFLTHRDGWRVEIPRVPLDELYGQTVTHWLTSRQGTIRPKCAVSRLESSGGSITAVELRSGERLAGEEFIVAVPWYRLPGLLPDCLREHPDLAGVQQLQSAPISSVHLWFDRPVLDLPQAVLTGRLSQWVFEKSGDRGAGEGEGPATCYLQVVISASRGVVERSQETVIADVVRELGEIWPTVQSARLQQARLVTEHRSVFAPLPGVDRWRPAQQSPVPNLQLAGDWTRTGWPATMEGAVRSGYLAASNVLARLGRPERLLQPDLPVGRLARWMLGLPRG